MRGIVRLSGPRAWHIIQSLFSRPLPEKSRRRFRPRSLDGQLALPHLNGKLPATLFLSGAPHSYTGQDLVELHAMGSPPILDLAIATVIAAGARQAQPGEFTLRA